MPRGKIKLQIVLVALLFAGVAAECWNSQIQVIIRNLLVDAGICAILISGFIFKDRILDLPLTRRRWFVPAASAALAMGAVWPTLQLPYLADDWQLLETRGRMPFWSGAFGVESGGLWYRPLGWAAWWIFDKCSAVDATPVRIIYICSFGALASLVSPALRRCGIPRGIAAAASFIFACSPAAFEMSAWISNIFGMLSAGCMLATIASLPVRRPTLRRMAAPCAFALCAFLSKEESFILPILAAAAFARFRWRLAARGAKRAIPFFIILACAVLLRQYLLENAGAYKDAQTGRSVLMDRAAAGPLEALSIECPGRYILPARWRPYSVEKRILWWTIPLLILAWGGISAEARRAAPRGILICAIGLAPVAPLLPIGEQLECARWLFVPTIGLSAVTAALLAGGPLRGRAAWLPVAGFVILSIVVARKNARAWESAGNAMNTGNAIMRPIVESAQPGARLWFVGLPWLTHGAYCYSYSTPFVYKRSFRRNDISYLEPLSAEGRFDRIVELDVMNSRAADYLDAGRAVALDRGRGWKVRFDDDTPISKVLTTYNLYELPDEGALRLRAGLSGIALTPIFKIPRGARPRIFVDGAFAGKSGADAGPLVYVTSKTADAYARNLTTSGDVVIPLSAEWIRFDLTVPYLQTLVLRSIRIEIAP
ncbi:MAG: hypothetical protein HY286_09065 [Planctomycetes bacterium]|nr:hypothetical protein [Planctomycetota bacterium]